MENNIKKEYVYIYIKYTSIKERKKLTKNGVKVSEFLKL